MTFYAHLAREEVGSMDNAGKAGKPVLRTAPTPRGAHLRSA